MPAKPFSVHLNLDEIAQRELAAALRQADEPGESGGRQTDQAAAHHGARDSRQAARERSGRDHAGRAGKAGGGRSYAFRRS
ncbi:hypothetical protein QLQ12_21330 [Actinoplanes sp. NEAU-A12]|uniref:Uncharacterized protein n=1 Tax=Actinoplanes sandaracinus TaxID=3045177 RepID=A0ABT6WN86_9ACTN|nr:hypothetical protein [Actinoplanes sandaracinus]MDI6101161.1 hypothetical protein [Actinoplanes sandaracinus]